MERADITIIGAGIVGLAIAASLAKKDRTVYILETNSSFGQETSSRNSEVIHAGLYYPQNSLKAITCVEGNRMVYQICQEHGIHYKKTGKLIVACEKGEEAALDELLQNARQNGVEDLGLLTQKQIAELEPNIKVRAALSSGHTGIVDSHNLMRYFLQKAKEQGAEFVFNSSCRGLSKKDTGYLVTVRDTDGSNFTFFAQMVINCAGLNSDRIAELAGLDIDKQGYRLQFCKGTYFRLGGTRSQLINRLIYPLPDKGHISLGIHATVDLGGSLRLGPDAQYIEEGERNYDIDQAKKVAFAQSVNKFLPFINPDDLTADTAGIRPKLQGPNGGFRDFIISHEEEKGLPGLINLIGIDSPGLTAAVVIAKYVQRMVETLL